MSFGISTDISRENLHAAGRLKQQEPPPHQSPAEQQLQPQSQSQLTGLVWAQQAETQTSVNKGSSPEILAPSLDDLAVLSTAVSLNDESVKAPEMQKDLSFIRVVVNPAALEESFKDVFKKSKSHNLLLERFMSNVKLSGIMMMMSLCGVPAGKIDEIKARVREEAIKEIDIKLRQDWAYTKAMYDITGG